VGGLPVILTLDPLCVRGGVVKEQSKEKRTTGYVTSNGARFANVFSFCFAERKSSAHIIYKTCLKVICAAHHILRYS
jgi:hypothetical protein